MTTIVSLDPWTVALLAGLFGLAVGSFLNVCTLRWPRDESVVSPPSRCPSCGEGIRWYDNVPVLSWLLLRGRCRWCGERISAQYPLVELATALIWAGMFARFGLSFEALRGSLFLTLLFGIALTDARFYVIPHQLSFGGAALGLLLALLPDGPTFVGSLVGGTGGYAILWLVAVGGTWMVRTFWPGRMEEMGVETAMGKGDMNMMAMVGAFLGLPGALLTIFLGSALGALIFAPISRLSDRLIPFGVFLAAGAAVTYGWGDAMIRWYFVSVLGMPAP